jgi:hypothetical protein
MSDPSLSAAAHENTAWKPRQVPRPTSGYKQIGPEVLRNVPEVTQRMGQIITCWGQLEWEMTNAFSYLIEAEGWVAAEMFQDIRKLRARIAIFLKHMRLKMDDVAASDAKKIINHLNDLQTERDKIAHGSFILSSPYPNAAIRVEGWGKEVSWYLYDIPTLDRMIKEFYQRGGEASSLFYNVMACSPPRYAPGRWIFPTPAALSAELLQGVAAPQRNQPNDAFPPPQTLPREPQSE